MLQSFEAKGFSRYPSRNDYYFMAQSRIYSIIFFLFVGFPVPHVAVSTTGCIGGNPLPVCPVRGRVSPMKERVLMVFRAGEFFFGTGNAACSRIISKTFL
jgi:hypothetical protein